MLFRIHSDIAKGEKDFFEINDGAQGIEEFNMLTSRQMFFVALVADRDYDSPLRTLPEKLRREKATVIAGWPLEDGKRPDKNARNLILGKVPVVEIAIKRYRELQPIEEDQLALDAVSAQIQEALYMMTRNKEEACTVTKLDKRNNSETTFVDQDMVGKMVLKAMDIGEKLPRLRKAKIELLERLKTTSPITDILTHTASDLEGQDVQDLLNPDSGDSTLDVVMEKEKKKNDESHD